LFSEVTSEFTSVLQTVGGAVATEDSAGETGEMSDLALISYKVNIDFHK